MTLFTPPTAYDGTVIADAGYGGEENYDYLEQNEIEAIVKYSTYHRDERSISTGEVRRKRRVGMKSNTVITVMPVVRNAR